MLAGYPPIGSLGAVGDGYSIALLGPDAALEWFCPERFDAMLLVWPIGLGSEGAFTLCSFWLVEALVLAGRGCDTRFRRSRGQGVHDG